jgi:hypothetical protein
LLIITSKARQHKIRTMLDEDGINWNGDIMNWFPRKSDYDEAIIVAPDETYHEKLLRYVNYKPS